MSIWHYSALAGNKKNAQSWNPPSSWIEPSAEEWSGSVTFGTETDPWIRIQILLFSSVAFKMPTKIKFFLLTYCRYIYWTAVFKDNIRKSKIKVSLNFFCLLIEGSGSRSESGSIDIIMDQDPGKTSGSGTLLHTGMMSKQERQISKKRSATVEDNKK